VGDTLWIDWDANTPPVSQVIMEISLDNGANWWLVPTGNSISTDDDRWGHYAWVLPDTIFETPVLRSSLVSTSCLIRVNDYGGQGSDESNAVFNIEPRGATGAAAMTIPVESFRVRQDVAGNLLVEMPAEGIQFEVVGLNGSVEYAGTAGRTVLIPRAALSAGLHVLRVKIATGVVTRRVVIW
jgi:hypothetical protein